MTKPLTPRARLLYRIVLAVCVIDMANIAAAIHLHDHWFAKLSMVICVAIAVFASQRLVQGRRKGVRA